MSVHMVLAVSGSTQVLLARIVDITNILSRWCDQTASNLSMLYIVDVLSIWYCEVVRNIG